MFFYLLNFGRRHYCVTRSIKDGQRLGCMPVSVCQLVRKDTGKQKMAGRRANRITGRRIKITRSKAKDFSSKEKNLKLTRSEKILLYKKRKFMNGKYSTKHYNYEFMKTLFEKNFVCVRLREFGIKRLKLKANQLIRHFTPTEIRRAATKLMKKKLKLNF